MLQGTLYLYNLWQQQHKVEREQLEEFLYAIEDKLSILVILS